MIITKLPLKTIKRLANKIFGSKIDGPSWKFRHLLDKKWSESYISKQSIYNPFRKFFIEKISAYFPFDNALEIGCASGPNLYLLAQKIPQAKFYGIDISKKAIETGKKFFTKENIKNVFLEAGKAENLKKIQDKSIDIIFTNAVLVCIGPDKIDSVIKEILRVAKKAIIFCEWHTDSPKSLYIDYWAHNYKLLLTQFVSDKKIKITKIPESLWGGTWGKLGYIIEVIL